MSSTSDDQNGCVFCDLPALDETHDAESLILARGAMSYLVLNKYPYNAGHLLAVPYRHCGAYEDVTVEEHSEVAMLVQLAVRALTAGYKPEGFNIGMNQGRAAGAGIAGHLHMHVVPRWAGDTNYMTTVGETKVLPEALEETYARLKPLVRGSAEREI